MLTLRRLAALLLLLVVSLVVYSCARNPVTGKRQISLVSESQEIEMGKAYDPQVVAQYGIYEDPQLQQFITEKGKAMAAVSHRPNLNYEFKIVDSPVVNAFAVPGGYVYFTRGIMAHFSSEAEFAGVLGHEIGHVTARHSAQQMTKQTLGQIGMIGGMIAVPELAQQSQLLSQALGLAFLKFGRDDERQSDKLGVEYSTEIGYDAQQMAKFFGTLQAMRGEAGADMPNFTSTHPNPGERKAKVLQMAKAAQAAAPGQEFKVGRDSYLRMIDGMVYGEDPKGGYEENGRFYHPVLKFQFPIPANWRTANSPAQYQMGEPNGRAIMSLTLAQGNDLTAAAQNFVQQAQMNVLDNKAVRVNGLDALAVLGEIDQTPQGQQPSANTRLRGLIYFIQYGGNIYQITGLTRVNDYTRYAPAFQRTMEGFAQLTDPSKLDRQPERIKIMTANRSATLQQLLQQAGIPGDRMREMAVLNGMELNATLGAGTLYKSLTGGQLRS